MAIYAAVAAAAAIAAYVSVMHTYIHTYIHTYKDDNIAHEEIYAMASSTVRENQSGWS